MLYQTHTGLDKGMSDSALKLSRLSIPLDLTGKSVLDIGCNEGFFCGTALSRGATRVTGIDFDAKALEFARSNYPGPQYIHSSWQTLPQGPFDLVLWSSAMHYELDPAKIFRQIHDRLSPDGLFILECGAFDRSAKEMVQVQRHSDTLWYPTIRLLNEDFLHDFSVRCVSYGVIAEGDPVPRYIFHCHKRMPTVILIRGGSRAGKGALADSLVPSATKLLQLDMLLSRVAAAKNHHDDLQRTIRDLRNKNVGLDAVYEGIEKAGLIDQLAQVIAQSVVPSDHLVVIEGAVTEDLTAALAKRFSGKAKFWQAENIV